MAYSLDLRKRVISAVRAQQQSLAEIAGTFGVSESTVDKWAKRWRDTKQVGGLPWAGGRKRSLRECEAAIRDEVRKQPDATLDELCTRVAAATGVVATRSMMSRELIRLDLPRKKRASMTASVTRPG